MLKNLKYLIGIANSGNLVILKFSKYKVDLKDNFVNIWKITWMVPNLKILTL